MTTTLSTQTGPAAAVPAAPPPFAVISGEQVQQVLQGRHPEVVDLVKTAYLLHDAGESVNPPSYFLRFPDRPTSRIIALPASIGGDIGVDGLKWVSSFPNNVAAGIPRASAVLLLNDQATGYPFACLEGSIISAARTAASAALAADWLSRGRSRPTRVGFFGVGLIARYLHEYLRGTGWEFAEIGLFDLSAASAEGFHGYLDRTSRTSAPGSGERAAAPQPKVTIHDTPESLIRSSDLVVFATIAGQPHVHDPAWFAHHPLVLHVSLRDLAPEIVLASTNVLDDIDHCLKADTSPHLAEQLTGGRDFIDGTLADVMTGRLAVPDDRTVIFSPFGLGVLDLAVGKFVYDSVAGSDGLHVVDGFFHELRRHG